MRMLTHNEYLVTIKADDGDEDVSHLDAKSYFHFMGNWRDDQHMISRIVVLSFFSDGSITAKDLTDEEKASAR